MTLWSTWDIAVELGVSKQTVHAWRRRYFDFPKPIAVVRPYIYIYDASAIRAWYRQRAKGNKQFGHPKGS